jgi:myosin heavy subunit
LPADQYNYLNCSGTYTVEGVDDVAEYEHLRKCMTAVGIAESAQNDLFTILSGILRLGNIEFQSTKNVEKEDVTTVKPTADQHLADAAELLGFDKDVLMDKLCFRSLIVGKGLELSSIRDRILWRSKKYLILYTDIGYRDEIDLQYHLIPNTF